MERLEAIAPDLAAKIASGGDAVQNVVVSACGLAVRESGLVDERSAAALDAVEAGRTDRSAAEAVRTLAEELDSAAWEAEAEDDATVYDLLFRRARAASALAFALIGDNAASIYEAAYAYD